MNRITEKPIENQKSMSNWLTLENFKPRIGNYIPKYVIKQHKKVQKHPTSKCLLHHSNSMMVCPSVSYQIETHIIDVMHVLARKEVTMFKTCCIGNKIWIQLGKTPIVTN
jgi:hypothetical protein